jgi:hypothetical protein
MKAIAKYLRYGFDQDNNIELTLLINHKSALREINQLEKDIDYDLNLSKLKGKRSLRQNRYMWQLLKEITLKMNYDNDVMLVYTQLIKQYGLPFEMLDMIPEAATRLLKTDKNNSGIFRVMDIVDARGNHNMYKCYYGTSSYSKEEMIVLIDGVLSLAVKCGIDTAYWTNVLC